jgi:hypothetical protein
MLQGQGVVRGGGDAGATNGTFIADRVVVIACQSVGGEDARINSFRSHVSRRSCVEGVGQMVGKYLFFELCFSDSSRHGFRFRELLRSFWRGQ